MTESLPWPPPQKSQQGPPRAAAGAIKTRERKKRAGNIDFAPYQQDADRYAERRRPQPHKKTEKHSLLHFCQIFLSSLPLNSANKVTQIPQ